MILRTNEMFAEGHIFFIDFDQDLTHYQITKF